MVTTKTNADFDMDGIAYERQRVCDMNVDDLQSTQHTNSHGFPSIRKMPSHIVITDIIATAQTEKGIEALKRAH